MTSNAYIIALPSTIPNPLTVIGPYPCTALKAGAAASVHSAASASV